MSRFKHLSRSAAPIACALFMTSVASGDVVSFQDGADGYTGTADTTLVAADAGSNFGALFKMEVAGPNGGDNGLGSGARQGLIRFDDIFGSGPGQIPVGSTINSATLSLDKLGGFGNVELFDLTVAFDENADTWDSLGAGIQLATETDGTAIGSADFGSGGGGDTVLRDYDVTASLASWASTPGDNLGWLLNMSPSNPGAAATIRAGDSGNDVRPILVVDFTPVPEPAAALGLLGLAGLAMRRRRA